MTANPCANNIALRQKEKQLEMQIAGIQRVLDAANNQLTETRRQINRNLHQKPRVGCEPVLQDLLDEMGMPTDRKQWQHEDHCDCKGCVIGGQNV